MKNYEEIIRKMKELEQRLTRLERGQKPYEENQIVSAYDLSKIPRKRK